MNLGLSPAISNVAEHIATMNLGLSPAISNVAEHIATMNLGLSPAISNVAEHIATMNLGLSPAISNVAEHIATMNLGLSPAISNVAEHVKNIHFIPEDFKLNIEKINPALINIPELTIPLQKELELVEKQNKMLQLLDTIITTHDIHFRKQNNVLNEIFKIIKELKEEQRLEHPFVDKLYKMALEWGDESIPEE
jgi:hypothetical protein